MLARDFIRYSPPEKEFGKLTRAWEGFMAVYDLVIRDGLVGTAADTFACDINMKNGWIAALEHDLPKGEHEIAAHGRLVLPSGTWSAT
jgi:hypothetical protein